MLGARCAFAASSIKAVHVFRAVGSLCEIDLLQDSS